MPITPQKVMQINDFVAGGKLDSHVFYAQYMRFMRGDYLGKMLTATITNKESYISSGTAIYTRSVLPQIEKYGDGTSEFREQPRTRFQVSIDQFLTAKYQWEDFDLQMLEASEFTSATAEGLAMSTVAVFDAEVCEYARDVAIVNKNYHKTTTFDSTMDKAVMEQDNLEWIDDATKLINIIDRVRIGTSKAELITVMSPTAPYRRIKGLGLTGGDVITNKYIGGELNSIAGWHYTSHGFIGKKIKAGSSFSLDKDYDFTNLVALLINTEALALPMGINTIKDVRNPKDANDGIVAKISYGKGVLHKELVKVYLKEYPTLQQVNAAFKNVLGIDNKFSDDSAAKAAGYPLQGDRADPTPDWFKDDYNGLPKTIQEANAILTAAEQKDGRKGK